MFTFQYCLRQCGASLTYLHQQMSTVHYGHSWNAFCLLCRGAATADSSACGAQHNNSFLMPALWVLWKVLQEVECNQVHVLYCTSVQFWCACTSMLCNFILLLHQILEKYCTFYPTTCIYRFTVTSYYRLKALHPQVFSCFGWLGAIWLEPCWELYDALGRMITTWVVLP